MTFFYLTNFSYDKTVLTIWSVSQFAIFKNRHVFADPITYIYVTGSEKRYIVAHNMIFLYKRFCSKTCNIFYSLKKIIFFAEVSITLCLHSRQI